MGGPDTIHLAGNELCELAPGHLYLPWGTPAFSALRYGQLQMQETRAKFLLNFSSWTLEGLLSEALPRALRTRVWLRTIAFCSCCLPSLGCLPLACPRDDTGDLDIYRCSCKRRKRPGLDWNETCQIFDSYRETSLNFRLK